MLSILITQITNLDYPITQRMDFDPLSQTGAISQINFS